MQWTEETERQLADLWATGLPASRIAAQLGASKNAVIGKARRLRLAVRASPLGTRPVTAAEQARIADLHARGASQRAIAVALKRDVQVIRRHVALLQLPEAAPAARQVLAAVPSPPPPPARVARPAVIPAPGAILPGPEQRVAPSALASDSGRLSCRMPLWKTGERPTHLYCGKPVLLRRDGTPTSWCRACAARVWLPPRAVA